MRKEEWKDRKLESGEEYKFPSSRGTNPTEETLSAFEKKLKENPKTLFGACVDTLNTSPIILEHAFDLVEVDKKKNAVDVTKAETIIILKKIQEIYSAPAIKPFVFEGALYSTEIGKPKEQEFENINAALNVLFLGANAEEPTTKEVKVETKLLAKKEKEKQAKFNQMTGLAVSEKENQEKGEAIFTNYSQLNELLSAIKKAEAKGLEEKIIIEKINSIKPIIKSLGLKKKKLVVKL